MVLRGAIDSVCRMKIREEFTKPVIIYRSEQYVGALEASCDVRKMQIIADVAQNCQLAEAQMIKF